MPTPFRLLLVEDNPGDARLTRFALGRLPPPEPEVTQVGSVEEAVATLARTGFDIILTDLDLPDSQRLETCKTLCAAARGMPVVVLTGSHDEELGLEAIQCGAQDYLVKGDFRVAELRRVLHHAKERQLMVVAVQEAKRSTEEALSRLRVLEEMREELTHMVVHDLRSPLFGMRLYLETFLRDAGDSIPKELRADVARTYDLTGTLVEMVSSILDVHRIESREMPVEMALCDLDQVIREAVEQIAGHGSRTKIVVELEPTPILCDHHLVRRTVVNLIGNALRYSPADRSVVVRSEILGSAVEVSVRDEGRGIPEESQRRIFEKFGSLDPSQKSHSTGLGLPFCKLAVEMHGGAIGVRSQPGAGSTFWFRLPLRGPAVDQAKAASPSQGKVAT